MSCTPRKNQNLTAEQCFSSTRGAQIKKKPGLQDEHRRPAAWKRRKGRRAHRPLGRRHPLLRVSLFLMPFGKQIVKQRKHSPSFLWASSLLNERQTELPHALTLVAQA